MPLCLNIFNNDTLVLDSGISVAVYWEMVRCLICPSLALFAYWSHLHLMRGDYIFLPCFCRWEPRHKDAVAQLHKIIRDLPSKQVLLLTSFPQCCWSRLELSVQMLWRMWGCTTYFRLDMSSFKEDPWPQVKSENVEVALLPGAKKPEYVISCLKGTWYFFIWEDN